MAMQGLEFPMDRLNNFSDSLLSDLAGNAFSATVALSAIACIMSAMQWQTESEAEDEDTIDVLMVASSS